MKEKILLLFILAGPLAPSFASENSEKYSFQDLEILSEQKNYREFLKHAKDIKPHQRNKHWKEMVQKIAIELTQFNLNLPRFSTKDENLIDKISHWPTLKNDEFFQIKYNQYKVRSTRHCLIKNPSSESCLNQAHQFWKFSNNDPDTGYQLATMIKGLRPTGQIWDFLSSIALHKVGHFYCQRPVFVKEFKEQLLIHFRPFIIPNKKNSLLGHQQIQQKINALIHPQCWKSFLPELKKIWPNEPPRHQVVIHKILKAKQGLEQEEEDLFYALYLLRIPLVGETFNRAWNALTKIGQDFTRRSSLLNKLAQQDPLEGKVFASPNTALSQTIIHHFSQNFPEYLKFYTQTCFEYLKGKKTFPNGNPTMECKSLLQISQNLNDPWVTQPLQMRFSAPK